MSEANKILAKQWFEQVWNQKSEEAIDQMFHADGKSYGFMDEDGPLVGPEAFKAVHRAFLTAFPDLHVDVEDVIAEGDSFAIRWKATMTHLGDGLGFPATGRKGVLRGSAFCTVKGGKILDGWNQMDMQGLLLRLQTP